MKQCAKCKKKKPESKFNKRADAKGGRQYWCRACVAINKSQNQHRRLGYSRRYYHNKIKKNDPWIAKSRRMLNAAVRSGKVKKPNICSKCCKLFPVAHIQGHHFNYNLPFSVIWLCRKCHAVFHKIS